MMIQITLHDLLILILCGLGIVAVSILIPILWNIKKIVGAIRPLAEKNQAAIDSTLKCLPSIAEDLGQICVNLRETTDKLKVSVPVILEEVEYVASTAKESMEMASAVMENVGAGINETIAVSKKGSLLNYINIFSEVVQVIYHAFSKK